MTNDLRENEGKYYVFCITVGRSLMCRAGMRDKRRGYEIEIVPLERTKLQDYTNLLFRMSIINPIASSALI